MENLFCIIKFPIFASFSIGNYYEKIFNFSNCFGAIRLESDAQFMQPGSAASIQDRRKNKGEKNNESKRT